MQALQALNTLLIMGSGLSFYLNGQVKIYGVVYRLQKFLV